MRKMSSFGNDFETAAGNAFGIAATILKIHNSVAGTFDEKDRASPEDRP
jgi:hypothetical protein